MAANPNPPAEIEPDGPAPSDHHRTVSPTDVSASAPVSVADVITGLKNRRDNMRRDLQALGERRLEINKEIARLRTELEQVERFLRAEHPRKRTPKASS